MTRPLFVKEKVTMSFKECRKVGVRPSDVAKLLQVSRVAASLWFNGHSDPHRLIAKRVHRLFQAVTSASTAGDLPLPHDTPRAKRYELFEKVILHHLGKLKLAPLTE
jgi:hypothetical protein